MTTSDKTKPGNRNLRSLRHVLDFPAHDSLFRAAYMIATRNQ
jgi:hypothetical protein